MDFYLAKKKNIDIHHGQCVDLGWSRLYPVLLSLLCVESLHTHGIQRMRGHVLIVKYMYGQVPILDVNNLNRIQHVHSTWTYGTLASVSVSCRHRRPLLFSANRAASRANGPYSLPNTPGHRA
jgi:hypothetical protein